MIQQLPPQTISIIPPDVCYNVSEYLQLKDQIMKACQVSEYIGLTVGLIFGAIIGILVYQRYRDYVRYRDGTEPE